MQLRLQITENEYPLINVCDDFINMNENNDLQISVKR